MGPKKSLNKGDITPTVLQQSNRRSQASTSNDANITATVRTTRSSIDKYVSSSPDKSSSSSSKNSQSTKNLKPKNSLLKNLLQPKVARSISSRTNSGASNSSITKMGKKKGKTGDENDDEHENEEDHDNESADVSIECDDDESASKRSFVTDEIFDKETNGNESEPSRIDVDDEEDDEEKIVDKRRSNNRRGRRARVASSSSSNKNEEDEPFEDAEEDDIEEEEATFVKPRAGRRKRKPNLITETRRSQRRSAGRPKKISSSSPSTRSASSEELSDEDDSQNEIDEEGGNEANINDSSKLSNGQKATVKIVEIMNLNKPVKFNVFESIDVITDFNKIEKDDQVDASIDNQTVVNETSDTLNESSPIKSISFQQASIQTIPSIGVNIVNVNNAIRRLLTKQDEQTMSQRHNQQQMNQKILNELPKVKLYKMKNYPLTKETNHIQVDYKLPPNFIKYIEKNSEELDEEVEYDMDEEDSVWLRLINEQRITENFTEIRQEQFELLMDRLEKESHFQTVASTASSVKQNTSGNGDEASNTSANGLNSSKLMNDSLNEDALCCICLDGECLNSNAILFCDMCNLAVHQECYGVPYIPEGQWLCRRCIQSPSAPVDCVLCPNRYGAFKETDRGKWAHVVCSIWIPEVHFANTVFLEPVIGIENIDKARWKLMCYICRKRNVGACIQCDKPSCYTAFHVTCAQQAGLYMNIQEEVATNHDLNMANSRKKKGQKNHKRLSSNGNNSNTSLAEVRKCAYCDIHTPLDVLSPRTRKQVCGGSSNANSSTVHGLNSIECEEAMKQAQKARMKRARKILAERRNAPPQICLPVIPKERVQSIIEHIEDVDNKDKFFERLMNYWLLKRYSRNGVPLLRRLQNNGSIKKNNSDKKANAPAPGDEPNPISLATTDQEKIEAANKIREQYREQMTYFKKLRQDLERARLLMELIRKRERTKRELVRLDEIVTLYQLNPFNGVFLKRLLGILVELDKNKIFYTPVDPKEVPTYYETIKEPMDFEKMLNKINKLEYSRFDQFEYDFNLIVNNCLNFNEKKTYFYKAAFKFREQATTVMKQAKRLYESQNVDESSKLNGLEKIKTQKKSNSKASKSNLSSSVSTSTTTASNSMLSNVNDSIAINVNDSMAMNVNDSMAMNVNDSMAMNVNDSMAMNVNDSIAMNVNDSMAMNVNDSMAMNVNDSMAINADMNNTLSSKNDNQDDTETKPEATDVNETAGEVVQPNTKKKRAKALNKSKNTTRQRSSPRSRTPSESSTTSKSTNN